MKLCVFCGSSGGQNPVYVETAKRLGEVFVENDIELVYGGGKLGLMGAIANAVIAAGGRVTGVIPTYLVEREVAHRGITNLIEVESMHQRKAKMAELADGFIAMPGGFGTFEEFIEIITWSMLGFHGKPCAILNTEGYYAHLLNMFQHATTEGFLHRRHRDMVLVESTPEALVQRILSYEHTTTPKFSEEDRKKT